MRTTVRASRSLSPRVTIDRTTSRRAGRLRPTSQYLADHLLFQQGLREQALQAAAFLDLELLGVADRSRFRTNTAIEQALLFRGDRDFDDESADLRFVRAVVDEARNAAAATSTCGTGALGLRPAERRRDVRRPAWFGVHRRRSAHARCAS